MAGHAIEARLYAEDPAAGFLPATGRVVGLHWPTGVRVDTGIRQGDEVMDRYDPLLAKLIVQGTDRSGALDALRRAFAATRCWGSAPTSATCAGRSKSRPCATAGCGPTHRPDGVDACPPDDEAWAAAAAGAVKAACWPATSGAVAGAPTLRLQCGCGMTGRAPGRARRASPGRRQGGGRRSDADRPPRRRRPVIGVQHRRRPDR